MSDPTPVQVHISAEQIATMLPAQHVEMLDEVESLKGADGLNLTDINNILGLILTALDNLNGTVNTLAGTVELLNNNASQNAQSQQQILLDGFGACCTETAYGTGEVEDLCQKAQDAIAYVAARLLSIGATYGGSRLPTVQELVSLFTYVGVDGRSYQLLSASEAGQLVGALNVIGVAGLSDLDCLLTDEGIKAAVLELLGTSNSAEQSTIRIQALPRTGYDCSASVAGAFFKAFSPTLINTLWKDPPIWDASPYEDICGEEPPFEGFGWYGVGGGTDTGIGPGNIVHTWQMDDSGDGSFSPNGFEAYGQGPCYCYCCFNTTVNGTKTVKVWTMDGSVKDTLICTLEPADTVAFTFPDSDDWGIEIVDPGNPLTDPSDVYLVFGWEPTGLSDHCPR